MTTTTQTEKIQVDQVDSVGKTPSEKAQYEASTKDDVLVDKVSDQDSETLKKEWADLPQLTFRAVIIGILLGTVVSASNMYIGLKIGWTFGASIFGAIFGYSILASLQKTFNLSKFGPKEHCTIQTAATAAGSGTTVGYVSGIPALYRLSLLSDPFGADLGKLLVWALAGSFYGIFFSIPLRKYFIIKQKLPFPSPTGAAEIIKSVHATASGSILARKKTKAMVIAFIVAFIWLTISFFVPIFKEWHFFKWIGEATNSQTLLDADDWAFYFGANFAFIGAGLMTPASTGVSSLAGSIIGWGIIGPYLLRSGITHTAFKFGANVTTEPSSRYWLLWPGIVLMIATSFTELGCRWKMIARAFSGFGRSLKETISRRNRKDVDVDVDAMHKKDDDFDNDDDPAPPSEQVPALWWGTGLLASIVLSIVVLKVVWNIGVGETLLAIFLGFILAFIAIQSSGETDINPTGSIAKTSQVVLSALPPITPQPGPELIAKQTASLAAGLVAGSAAHQSADMVGDLKTGHILLASPRSQFLAQSIGALASVFTGIGFWVLFIKAYPCIISSELECKTFSLTAVTAWQGITMALTTKNAIPLTSLYTSIGLGIFVIVFVIIKNNWIPERYHPYLPNFNAIGIAFTNTDQSIMISLFAGSVAGLLWKRRWPANYELYMFAIASGLIAGEGINGVLEAVFTIGGLTAGMGSTWGT